MKKVDYSKKSKSIAFLDYSCANFDRVLISSFKNEKIIKEEKRRYLK